MKKVKVMLAGIAILAVLGGTFAFKAKNAFGSVIFTTTTTNFAGTAGACGVQLNNSTVQLDPITGVNPIYYTINGTTKDCFATSVTPIVQN